MDLQCLRRTSFWEGAGSVVAGDEVAAVAGLLPGASVAFKTSGTTGSSKWVVLEKRSLLLSARMVNEWLEVDSAAKWGLALPLHHVGGFGVVARAYAAGCGFAHFHRKWEPRELVEWLEREDVTHLSLVPTQVHDLVKAGVAAPAGLRAVVVGGGRLSNEVAQKARVQGWPVLTSYGMTEAGSQIATQELASLQASSASGKLKILPIWNVGTTSEGLLRIRGEALFSGTLEQRGEKRVFQPREEEWFQTNDRVELQGGQLKPLGRADTLVKILGELVDIEAVERRFLELTSGRVTEDCFAIVPVADERREHALIAVFEESKGGVAEAFELYQKLAPGIERLSGHFAIGRLPRTDMGKLRRAELRELASEWRARER